MPVPFIYESTITALPPRLDHKAEKSLVLIVEDNQDLVKYLITSLNPTYNLEVAYNGQQGIDKAIALIPDIIITDVMMPEKDGFELCHVLKRHELTSHIPIIMLTAKVDMASRLGGLKRGADAYMEKPFIQEELQIRIRAILDQRQKLQAFYRSQAGLSKKPQELLLEEETKVETDFLAELGRIIKENIGNQDFTVEQLSNELFVSPSSLYRKLKALIGVNPIQYIRSFRLIKAKELLSGTSKSIATIADETGFRSPDYFTKIFKREEGITPSKYRDNHSF